MSPRALAKWSSTERPAVSMSRSSRAAGDEEVGEVDTTRLLGVVFATTGDSEGAGVLLLLNNMR